MHHKENYGVIERCDMYVPKTSLTASFVECFFSAEVEMATIPAVGAESIQKQSNGLRLVNWANKLLKISFEDVQQFGSGALSA